MKRRDALSIAPGDSIDIILPALHQTVQAVLIAFDDTVQLVLIVLRKVVQTCADL